jgi:hypothetical protein
MRTDRVEQCFVSRLRVRRRNSHIWRVDRLIGAGAEQCTDCGGHGWTETSRHHSSATCVHVTHVIDFNLSDGKLGERRLQRPQQKLSEASCRTISRQSQQSRRFVDESHLDRFVSMRGQYESAEHRGYRVHSYLIVMNCTGQRTMH